MKYKKETTTDYIAYCIECGEPLIKLGMWLIHPDNKCAEDDGVKTLIQYRKKFDEFQKKYILPDGNIEKLIKKHNKLVDSYENTICRRISKWFIRVKEKVQLGN
jgi:hypothetical protein|tara:strand:- start:12 stop:323 length:312 start_codon:yes stop_codon:yes gene_type:complete